MLSLSEINGHFICGVATVLIANWPQAFGHRALATCVWPQSSVLWPQAFGHSPLAAGLWPQEFGHSPQSPVATLSRHRSLVIDLGQWPMSLGNICIWPLAEL